MPAKSEKQRRAAGAALSAKRGKTSPGKLIGASKQMYESMSEQDLVDFAKKSDRDAAPGYHEALTNGKRCSTCDSFSEGTCTRYEFMANGSYVCDSWSERQEKQSAFYKLGLSAGNPLSSAIFPYDNDQRHKRLRNYRKSLDLHLGGEAVSPAMARTIEQNARRAAGVTMVPPGMQGQYQASRAMDRLNSRMPAAGPSAPAAPPTMPNPRNIQEATMRMRYQNHASKARKSGWTPETFEAYLTAQYKQMLGKQEGYDMRKARKPAAPVALKSGPMSFQAERRTTMPVEQPRPKGYVDPRITDLKGAIRPRPVPKLVTDYRDMLAKMRRRTGQ